MTEVRPRCKCQMNCPHHRNDPGGCTRFATNLEDRLCAECREAKIKSLEDELREVKKEIEKSKIALAALQIGISPEGELEDEGIILLDEHRRKLAREVDYLKSRNL
jgi:hypothetical protein